MSAINTSIYNSLSAVNYSQAKPTVNLKKQLTKEVINNPGSDSANLNEFNLQVKNINVLRTNMADTLLSLETYMQIHSSSLKEAKNKKFKKQDQDESQDLDEDGIFENLEAADIQLQEVYSQLKAQLASLDNELVNIMGAESLIGDDNLVLEVSNNTVERFQKQSASSLSTQANPSKPRILNLLP